MTDMNALRHNDFEVNVHGVWIDVEDTPYDILMESLRDGIEYSGTRPIEDVVLRAAVELVYQKLHEEETND